jgi:hypothetical protein
MQTESIYIRSIHRRLPAGDVRLTGEAARMLLLLLHWRQHPTLIEPWDGGSLVFSVGAMSRRLGKSTMRIRDALERLQLMGLLTVIESGYRRVCVLPLWPSKPTAADIRGNLEGKA